MATRGRRQMLDEAERRGFSGEVHVAMPSEEGLLTEGFAEDGTPLWGAAWEEAQKAEKEAVKAIRASSQVIGHATQALISLAIEESARMRLVSEGACRPIIRLCEHAVPAPEGTGESEKTLWQLPSVQ